MNRGAHVVAAQSVIGGELVGSHAFFGQSAQEAQARFEAYQRRKQASSLGQAPPAMVWESLSANSGGDYSFSSGHRYAVLASVSRNYSLSDVQNYLAGHGWIVSYAWEQGQPSRGVYAIDSWLDSLAPDPTSNHRWLYAEANRTGADVEIGQSAPWPLTLYSVAHVFEAVPAPPTAPSSPPIHGPSLGPVPKGPSGATLLGAGLAVGAAATLVTVLVRRLL